MAGYLRGKRKTADGRKANGQSSSKLKKSPCAAPADGDDKIILTLSDGRYSKAILKFSDELYEATANEKRIKNAKIYQMAREVLNDLKSYGLALKCYGLTLVKPGSWGRSMRSNMSDEQFNGAALESKLLLITSIVNCGGKHIIIKN